MTRYYQALIGFAFAAAVSFLVVLCVAGCKPRSFSADKLCCNPDEAGARRDWVLECIRHGNPMSDEEPEDLVAECGALSFQQFCTDVSGVIYTETGRFVPNASEPVCRWELQ